VASDNKEIPPPLFLETALFFPRHCVFELLFIVVLYRTLLMKHSLKLSWAHFVRGHAVAQSVEALRYKGALSISDGVIGIFH